MLLSYLPCGECQDTIYILVWQRLFLHVPLCSLLVMPARFNRLLDRLTCKHKVWVDIISYSVHTSNDNYTVVIYNLSTSQFQSISFIWESLCFFYKTDYTVIDYYYQWHWISNKRITTSSHFSLDGFICVIWKW